MSRSLAEAAVIERGAKNLRGFVRGKAGLPPGWQTASESMKEWYRHRVEQMLVDAGEIEKC